MRVLVVTAVQTEADAVAAGLGDGLRPPADAPPAVRHAAPEERGETSGDRRAGRDAAPDGSSHAVALPGHTLRQLRLPAAATAQPGAALSGVTADPAHSRTSPNMPGAPNMPSVPGAGRPAAGARPPAPCGTVVDLLTAGVGPAAAAAGTSAALTAGALMGAAYDLVVSAGIGGGFPAAPVGTVVVADAIVAADLGAEAPPPDGFLPVDGLGFGRSVHLPPAERARRMAEALNRAGRPAVHAPVLTVSTVTGSAERAAELLTRHPHAAAEAMEGFGVAEAAAAQGVPVFEIRAVSNAVGPRDRSAWRIGQALDSLRHAFHLLAPILEEESR